MNLIFTLCSNNYMAQAIALGNSILKHNPSYKFIIGLVDRETEKIDYNAIPFEIIEVEKIGIEGFDEMVMRYNIVELNTSVKPFYFKFFINTGIYETLIYLDPDIEIFAPFEELEIELGTNDIVITPHFFSPFKDDKWQAEEDFLNSGLYNLGFIAIKNTKNSEDMIDWWAERLRTKAKIDFCRGLFTDQIWINFAPLYFENVMITKNPGYNVAYWNLHERTISEKNKKYYINEIYPLVFYHYASFRPLNPENISLHQNRFTFEKRPDIVPLFKNYCDTVFSLGYKEFNAIPCYFVKLKEDIEKASLAAKIKGIPGYKKFAVKILKPIRFLYRTLIKKMGLVLDYSSLK